jgi:branched-chain amino acid transport system substrate-binding protein
MTDARLKELGVDGMLAPFALSCSQHEGAGKFALMQWDGKAQAFKKVKDWTGPNDPAAIRAQIVESAAKYAEENKITPKKCS